MARALGALAAGGGFVGSTTLGTLLTLCAVAAVLGAVVFACGHKSRKNKPKYNNQDYAPGYNAGYNPGYNPAPNVTYYGNGGGRQKPSGMGGAATGLAVGAGVGLAAGVAIDAVAGSGCGGGGGGCGGGGCGGGGCGGGGCGG